MPGRKEHDAFVGQKEDCSVTQGEQMSSARWAGEAGRSQVMPDQRIMILNLEQC